MVIILTIYSVGVALATGLFCGAMSYEGKPTVRYVRMLIIAGLLSWFAVGLIVAMLIRAVLDKSADTVPQMRADVN